MTRLALAIGIALAVTQTATGSMSGTILDPDGGTIPGVTVTATLGADRRSATTDYQGRFRMENLPPGHYEIAARLSGFEPEIDDNVRVSAGVASVWNRKLRIGSTHATSREPVRADPMPPAVAQPIYAAVLRDIFKNAVPDRVVIEAESVMARPDREATLLGAPAELRTRMNAPELRESVWLNAAALPAGAQLVRRTTIAETFRSAPALDPLGGWDAFRQKYGVTSYVGLGRPIISADGRDALVYFTHRCGNVCGEGTLLWLRRASADSPWTVLARRGFWVS